MCTHRTQLVSQFYPSLVAHAGTYFKADAHVVQDRIHDRHGEPAIVVGQPFGEARDQVNVGVFEFPDFDESSQQVRADLVSASCGIGWVSDLRPRSCVSNRVRWDRAAEGGAGCRGPLPDRLP